MRTEREVLAMFKKFDDADIAGDLDDEGQAVLTTLNWVLGHNTDDYVEEYLPEKDDEDE